MFFFMFFFFFAEMVFLDFCTKPLPRLGAIWSRKLGILLNVRADRSGKPILLEPLDVIRSKSHRNRYACCHSPFDGPGGKACPAGPTRRRASPCQ
ncbi:hypothetical protein LY76DRAFT_213971 [Colletotrichum caudatum]|nr:hypothetical protein LY76DRAFT_213971 [Colletotrichum caudatum]